MKHKFLYFLIFLLPACGNGGLRNTYAEPVLTAVDSTNDRLFVLEKNGLLFAFTASTRAGLGHQPVVNTTRQVDIHVALPSAPTQVAVLRSETTSRLFIAGAQANANGDQVFNQILVLDFDGTTFTEASFSPIILAGADANNAIIGGLAVDATNSRLYVTDATSAQLFSVNTSNGTVPDTLAIAGSPNRMSLDGIHLYVANASTVLAERVITVVDTTDLSTTTIDLGSPLDDISVLSNDDGTALLAKERGTQKVFIKNIDTTDIAAGTPSAGDITVADGEITAAEGISSSVSRVLITKSSDGTLYGYAAQSDGTLIRLTIVADLATFTARNLTSTAEGLTGLSVLTDAAGLGITVFSAGSTSGDLVYSNVGSSIVSIRS